MKRTTQLKKLIQDEALLVMPGGFDPISAKLIERAGYFAIQCTGASICAVHHGVPDYGIIGRNEMVSVTRVMSAAVEIPVMADGDAGFGNAVSTYLTVKAFEDAGAAGINLEDQVMPKRCGHLQGKEIGPFDEAVERIQAAVEARRDPDFIINARTDALATDGIEEVIRRGNAFLAAGADMVFVEGASSVAAIKAATAGIDGPVGVNLVEGGKTPEGLTFELLQDLGVARVSLPGSLLFASVKAMSDTLERIRSTGGVDANAPHIADFQAVHSLAGMAEVNALERRFYGDAAE